MPINGHHRIWSLLAAGALALSGCGMGSGESLSYYGEEGAFAALDFTAEHGPGAPHDPVEPPRFDAGWVGRESYEVLQAAKRGEYPYSSVSTSAGPCTVFHDNKLVRRMLLGNGRRNEPTEEITFTAAGHMVLWFRSDRADSPTWEWAYFQRGNRLALYQRKPGNAARVTTPAPADLARIAQQHAATCLSRFGATNPLPGSATPQPPAPAPGALALTLQQTAFVEGEGIPVTLNQPVSAPAGQQYWVALVEASAPDTEFGTWQYLPNGANQAWFAAATPGTYEVRLHDLYPLHKRGRVLARQRITIDSLGH